MEHVDKVLLPLHLGNLDLSISSTVAWMLLATLCLVAFLLAAVRNLQVKPSGKLQVMLEMALDFTEKQLIGSCGLKAGIWTVLILTIFLFILFNNFISIIPGATPATGNINLTGSLAFLLFATSILGRLITHRNPVKAIGSILPDGVHGVMTILMLPIELISQLFKPLSLALRLFANLSGGHLLLLSILGLSTMFRGVLVKFLSVGGTAVVILFELFVGFIQAYIFSLLAALMLGEALETEKAE